MTSSRRTAVALLLALLQVVPLVHGAWGGCVEATSGGCCTSPADASADCCHEPAVGASRPACACCDVPTAPAPSDAEPARVTLDDVVVSRMHGRVVAVSLRPGAAAPRRELAPSPGAPPPDVRVRLGVFLI